MSVEEALGIALRAFSSHERTVSELAGLLERRGIDATEAAEVIDLLVSDGTVDDERFARLYAEDKREIAGWGADRIRETLLRRGVGSAEVEAALGSESGELELERAVGIVLGRGLDLGGERDRGKALGLLARRGFDADVAYEAIRRAERETVRET